MTTNSISTWYRKRLGRRIAFLLGQYLEEADDGRAGEKTLILGCGAPYAHLWEECGGTVVLGVSEAEGEGAEGEGQEAEEAERKRRRIHLTEGRKLPFQEGTFDRVLLIHALEFTAYDHDLMKDVRRVLRPQGHVIAVVPNRLGLWSRREDFSPFGHGRPYTQAGLEQLLVSAPFVPLHVEKALFTLPLEVCWQNSERAERCEKVAAILCPWWGGVWVAVGRKESVGGIAVPADKAVWKGGVVPVPVAG